MSRSYIILAEVIYPLFIVRLSPHKKGLDELNNIRIIRTMGYNFSVEILLTIWTNTAFATMQ